MCGIFAIIGSTDPDLRKKAIELSKKQLHRGPDWTGCRMTPFIASKFRSEPTATILCHERLAIVDLENGAQPLTSQNDTIWLSVNGEIYNHEELRALPELSGYTWKTRSDCEPIIALYMLGWPPKKWLNMLKGDFAFILHDTVKHITIVARDPIGVCPLYTGFCSVDGSCRFSSEMRTLQDCNKIKVLVPGSYLVLESAQYKELSTYYEPTWLTSENTFKSSQSELVDSLTEAVSKRLMCDVPFGVLLSGGLDSSLIAGITAKLLSTRGDTKWGTKLHTFCIGLPNAPDFAPARKVAEHIGSIHHEFHFTIQDGIDSLPKVIEHLETYDVTTIRASTPMFLLARKIKAMGIKMTLSGEGSDEVMGGYLYFHNAPSIKEFHEETINRVQNLHKSDCLRANKSTMAWGLEIRVPFLDRDFLDVAMNIDPKLKFCNDSDGNPRIEKWVLRDAFYKHNLIPSDVLWRQKEQFSDSVGFSWIDSLKQYTGLAITDELFQKASELFPFNTPTTKEAFYYRQIFEEKFPNPESRRTVDRWIPKWSVSTDPSGRVQSAHLSPVV